MNFFPRMRRPTTNARSFLFFFLFPVHPTNFRRRERCSLARSSGALSFSSGTCGRVTDLVVARAQRRCCTAREGVTASRGGGPRTVTLRYSPTLVCHRRSFRRGAGNAQPLVLPATLRRRVPRRKTARCHDELLARERDPRRSWILLPIAPPADSTLPRNETFRRKWTL